MENVGPIIGNVEQLIGKTDAAEDAIQAAKKNNELGKEAFLRLLTTQLRHQNPLEPMDNQQFVAQMAEFSALEQMQNLNKSFEAMALVEASSIIGKSVEALRPGDDSETTISGVVSSVKLSGEEMTLIINGTEIPASNVQTISEPTTTEAQE